MQLGYRAAVSPAAVRRAALLVVAGLGGGIAHAGPTTVTAEGGGEGDSNVQRVETGPALETDRRAAPVVRLGARVDHRGRLAGGGYAVAASALARVVAHRDTPAESVALFAADLRYLRPVGTRPVAVGLGVAAADALPVADDRGARTFRTLAADAMLVLRGSTADARTRALTLSFGPRAFTYKPNREFDWTGPAAAARLDLTLWQTDDADARSLELAVTAGFEARAYDGTALASACAPDAEPSRDCFAPTTQPRRDRFQRAAVEVTYTGAVIAAAGYQLTVIDSNSFGQSIVRHRLSASATVELPGKLITTALATLQLDNYIDGLLQQKDLQFQEFTSLDDVNRSSLQLRISRKLSAAWSAEARAAVWRDLGSDTMATSYRREVGYLGAVYSR